MTHPSKRKGNRFERELVRAFEVAGLRAERAWGSDGRALRADCGKACASGVDLLVEGGLKVQAKRRRSVAKYLKPPEGAHLTIVREDHADALAVVPLSIFTRLLKAATTHNQPREQP